MQTLLEAATHIAQEIERTRQHLVDLEQALSGLQPLITIEAAATPLSFTTDPQPQSVVEDVSVVSTKTSRKKAAAKSLAEPKAQRKAKAKASAESKAKASENAASAGTLPPTGSDLWIGCAGTHDEFNISELVQAALQTLNLDETAKSVLTNRARAWISNALKKGTIVQVGKRDGTNSYAFASA